LYYAAIILSEEKAKVNRKFEKAMHIKIKTLSYLREKVCNPNKISNFAARSLSRLKKYE